MTPMTHLFVDTPNVVLLIPGTDAVVNVTRTDKVFTLINLALMEPETVFRVFNEKLTSFSLDKFFRNKEEG